MAIPSRTKLAKYFAELQRIEEHRSLTAEKQIRKLYTEMLTNLQGFLGVEFAKFAEDDVLKYSTLAQKGEYARFLEEVQAKVNYISPKVNKVITDTVKDVYKTAYEGMVEAVAKSVNDEELAKTLSGIKLTQPQVIKAAVNNPVSKLTLSKTLEKSRKQIIYNIKQTVTVGIMNGDRMSTMANRIKNDVDQNYRKAMLIARTEVHRVRETGHNNSSNEIDKKLAEADSKYRMVKIWRSKQDIKTRRTSKADHVKMHGQVVLQEEEFNLGDTTAPCPGESGKAHHDCNCRCRISRDLWSDEEFFEATGRHFKKVEKPKETKNAELTDQSNIYELKHNIKGKEDVEKHMQDMSAEQREIWKKNITTTKYKIEEETEEGYQAYNRNTDEVTLFNTSSASTFFHETSHAIDKKIAKLNITYSGKELRGSKWIDKRTKSYDFNGASSIAEELYGIDREKNYAKDITTVYEWAGVSHNGIETLENAQDTYTKIKNKIKEFGQKYGDDAMETLSDMIDATTRGEYPLWIITGGHGKEYWESATYKEFSEAWAEISSLKATGQNKAYEEISMILPEKCRVVNTVYEVVYNDKPFERTFRKETDSKISEQIWKIEANPI